MFDGQWRKTAYHDYFNSFLKSKSAITKILSKPIHEASILIIGCGYLYPDVFLYSKVAKEVVGIDVVDCFWRDGLTKYFINNFRNKRNLKDILVGVNKILRNRLGVKKGYYGWFEGHMGQKVSHDKLTLISYDGLELPFDDNSFDVVLSNAVIEHMMELDLVTKEMARVTSPNGINYHLYHNYYSFSGNHQPYYMNKRYPWGHLRGLIDTNPNHLNKVKISELESHFQKYFSRVSYFSISQDHSRMGLDDGFSWEEEELFEKYRRVLEKQYSEELLLSRAFLIVGERKRKHF